MTVRGIRAAMDSSTTLEPSSSSPKKSVHHAISHAPPQENQSTTTTTPSTSPPSSRPVASSQRSGILLALPPRMAQNAGDIVGDYALGETIGKGTFGKVKLGLHMLTGEKVAVKILEKKRIVEVADVERVAREIKILKRNRHVNVIQLFEVIDSPERIFLIMEFVDGGEMFEYIVAHHRIRETEAVVLFQQIVDGLDYLHANEVTHRDLKPENLLLQSCAGMPTGVLVKIVDFGLSNTHDGGRLLRTACGSPCYAAPEMIQGKLYKGPLADVWSLGVVLFAMVCGYLPFEDSNTNLLYKKILSADYKLPPFLSHAVQDLIRRIFETNPEKRYTTEMIRQHPWFQSSRNHVPRCVTMAKSYDDPRLRHHILSQLATVGLDPIDVEDALSHKAHNHLTAAFFLLYNKLLRVMKDQPAPPPHQHQQSQGRHQPQPSQPPASSSSAKSDGTPRRPEIAAGTTEEVRSTGIRTKEKEMVPVKAPSSTTAITSESFGAHQRRRASDVAGTSSATARPSPRHHLPIPTATSPAAHGHNASLPVRRPSSVRGGRNLVLLTNGTQSPVSSTAAAPPHRPQIPTRPPSQGGGPRVSISNGMVALTPLFGQKRPDASAGVGRRQTILDGKTSPPHGTSMALTATAVGASGHVRRRTATSTTPLDAAAAVVSLSPATAATPQAPLAPRNSVRKEDDTRATATTTEPLQQRIPPQRPQPPLPST